MKLTKSMEEDAVFSGHTDEFWEFGRKTEKELFDLVFTTENTDFDSIQNLSAENQDFTDTIASTPEMLRIYIVSGITMLTQEAVRRGIPDVPVSEIKRRAFVLLGTANDPDKWPKVAAEVIKGLHQLYLEKYRSDAGDTVSPLIRRACAFISLHRRENISASDAAACLHVNRTYLAKQFRLEMNTTISDYILSVKMREAAEWISEGKYPLIEIAPQLGFSSYSYFSRRFKDFFGVSPKEYEKKNR